MGGLAVRCWQRESLILIFEYIYNYNLREFELLHYVMCTLNLGKHININKTDHSKAQVTRKLNATKPEPYHILTQISKKAKMP